MFYPTLCTFFELTLKQTILDTIQPFTRRTVKNAIATRLLDIVMSMNFFLKRVPKIMRDTKMDG